MWIKLDDQFPDHPKVKSVGAIGLALQTAAICYCGRYLTDGFLPFAVADALIASVLAPFTIENVMWTVAFTSGMSGEDAEEWDWKKVMVDAGLWDRRKNGFQVHDYLDYNPDKESVERTRESTKLRVSAFRHKHLDQVRNAVGNAVTNDPVTVLPSPSPSFKDLKEKSTVPIGTTNSFRSDTKEILQHLNDVTNHAYRDQPANLKPIEARLKSGVSKWRIIAMVDAKAKEWGHDPKMAKYLRPETLFGATKFESYIAEITEWEDPER